MYVCDKISLEPKGLSIISLLWLVMSSIIVLSDPSHNMFQMNYTVKY